MARANLTLRLVPSYYPTHSSFSFWSSFLMVCDRPTMPYSSADMRGLHILCWPVNTRFVLAASDGNNFPLLFPYSLEQEIVDRFRPLSCPPLQVTAYCGSVVRTRTFDKMTSLTMPINQTYTINEQCRFAVICQSVTVHRVITCSSDNFYLKLRGLSQDQRLCIQHR